MGVVHKAVVGVGLPAKNLAKDYEEYEGLYGDVEDDLQLVAPHLDADYGYCMAGILVYEIEDGAIDINMTAAQYSLYMAMDKFRSLTGKSGKVFLSTLEY